MKNHKQKQLIQAIHYIYEHIDQSTLTIENIAKMVGVSTASLKRLFQKSLDQSVGAFIRRLRMELAFKSLQSRNESVLEIALSAGFDDQSAFTRRFREVFGYAPTHARNKLNIVQEFECVTLEEPDIVEFSGWQIQCITEQGRYFESAPRAWEKLYSRLFAEELSDDFTGLFIGIGHDNPHEGDVAEDQVRFSAGVSLDERDLAIEQFEIAEGYYARFRYVGRAWNLGLAYHYIYGKWSEASGIHISNATPAFTVFSQFPNPSKEEQILIYVPILNASR